MRATSRRSRSSTCSARTSARSSASTTSCRQIIDYGDPELEKKQIYLRHLERVIQPNNYTAPIDLSDVVLKAVKQVDKGKTDISLGDRVGLTGMTARRLR